MEQRKEISSAELLEKLLVAMGKGEAEPTQRAIIERHLQLLKCVYQGKAKTYTAVEDLDHRKLLRQVLNTKDKLRGLRQKLKPLETEIWSAGWDSIHEPGGEAGFPSLGPEIENMPREQVMAILDDLMDPERIKKAETTFDDLMDPARMTKADEAEEMSIRSYLSITFADYQKTLLRKHLIEPFLRELSFFNVTPSPHGLPLTRMMEALFDWVGVDQTRRPSHAGIGIIARDFKCEIERRHKELKERVDQTMKNDEANAVSHADGDAKNVHHFSSTNRPRRR